MYNPQLRTPDGRPGGSWARRVILAISIACVALAGASCAKARAETVPDGPPLATPAPPPRVLAPVEEVLAEAPAPPEVPPETPPPAPASPRPTPRRPPVATVEPKPPETVAPAPQPAPPAEAIIRTPAANPAEEKKIGELLSRAERDLNRVDYRNLTSDGKQQYNDSKRFSELAIEAVKARDYALASTLADKAATVASGLLGR